MRCGEQSITGLGHAIELYLGLDWQGTARIETQTGRPRSRW